MIFFCPVTNSCVSSHPVLEEDVAITMSQMGPILANGLDDKMLLKSLAHLNHLRLKGIQFFFSYIEVKMCLFSVSEHVSTIF